MANQWQVITPELKQKIIDLYASGLSYEDVGNQLKVNPSTVAKYVKRSGIARVVQLKNPKKYGKLLDLRNCIDCKYRNELSFFNTGTTITCDYIGHTGKARQLICRPGWDCTVKEVKQ